MIPKLSTDQVNERLRVKNIEILGEYKSARTRTMFKCIVCEHTWETSSDSVMRLSGCPSCALKNASDRYSFSNEIVVEKIKSMGMKLIGPYQGMKVRTQFECSCGNKNYFCSPSNILYSRSHCKECASFGFKPHLFAYAYIIAFETFIKYGITNDLEQRFKSHKKCGNFSIKYTKFFEYGYDAVAWENSIKDRFGGNFVSREYIQNGFTETLDLTLLNEVQLTL